MSNGSGPGIFISYAHEPGMPGHRDRALQLSDSLRGRGLTCTIDQYVEHDPPVWPQWMKHQVKAAKFVLCLASPRYKERVDGEGDPTVGRGARWEGLFITEELYKSYVDGYKKFIAVLVQDCSVDDIPDVLLPLGTTHYRWPEDDEDLYRRLTNQPRVVPAAIGDIVAMPTFSSTGVAP